MEIGILHEENEKVRERYLLAKERIAAFREEKNLGGALRDYFVTLADFIALLTDVTDKVFSGALYTMELSLLQELNNALYKDLLAENYGHCFGNPSYAAAQLGEEYGQLLSVVYSEIHSLTACAFEGRLFGLTCGMELLIGLYNCFEVEGQYTGREIKEALYYYLHDYQEEFFRVRAREKYDPSWAFARDIIMGRNLNDLRYLYFYGEYISENDLKLAGYINSLPEEVVERWRLLIPMAISAGFRLWGRIFRSKVSSISAL